MPYEDSFVIHNYCFLYMYRWVSRRQQEDVCLLLSLYLYTGGGREAATLRPQSSSFFSGLRSTMACSSSGEYLS